jgi:thiamine biosynthesis lipoprotein
MVAAKPKHWLIAFVTVAVLLLVAAYSIVTAAAKTEVDSGHRLVMGTFARVVVVAKNTNTAETCIRAAFEEIENVDRLMSDYKEKSEISKINRLAADKPVKASEPTYEVLKKSIAFSKLTDGAFDITVGPLVDLWRSAAKKGRPPTEQEIAQAKTRVGFEKLVLDDRNRTVKFAVDGMRLDLGGIAKGYAIDKAVDAMQKRRAVGGMVDIGGDIRCFGTPAGKKDTWRIGLQDPNAERGTQGRVLLTLQIEDKAVATSGDYQQFVLIGEKRYSHIISRDTGCGAAGLSSVTILADKTADADALATAVSILGANKGLALVESLPDTEAILITAAPEYDLIETKGAGRSIR